MLDAIRSSLGLPAGHAARQPQADAAAAHIALNPAFEGANPYDPSPGQADEHLELDAPRFQFAYTSGSAASSLIKPEPGRRWRAKVIAAVAVLIVVLLVGIGAGVASSNSGGDQAIAASNVTLNSAAAASTARPSKMPTARRMFVHDCRMPA
jgi:hypothetical protein